MNDQPLDRLQELFKAQANETLAPEQHAELQAILRDNPEAQDRNFAFIDLQLGLRSLLNGGCPVASCGTTQSKTHAKVSVDRQQKSRFAVRVTLATLLLVVGAVAIYFRPSSDDNAVVETVRLRQSAGAAFFGQDVPSIGGALEYDREYALTSGMIELRFPDGAEVILEAPSVIEIPVRDRLIVKVGECSVHAPPGAEGFRVDTPQADVIDLGTRFTVRVNETGKTDVQVIEGAADVHSHASRTAVDTIHLIGGDSRRFLDQSEGAAQPMPFDPDRYRHDLPDRVVDYAAREDQQGHVDQLLSVTVQRGGHHRVYPVRELIESQVRQFRAGVNTNSIAVSATISQTPTTAVATDSLLNTGLINPGGALSPLSIDPTTSTPGLAVSFAQPVVNGFGPDVVLFEMQSVFDPPGGDAFHVCPLTFVPGLKSHSIRDFDITLIRREARTLATFELRFFDSSPQTLDELFGSPAGQRRPALRFRALAVGIDLSDLGYPAQAEVSGLFFQDAMDDDHQVDPVFIAGLPNEVAP